MLGKSSGLLAILLLLMTAISNADAPPSQTVHFTNGSTAISFYECGDMDLCSLITNRDGSTLSIYSEGATKCQPYFLHFVRADETGKTQYEFSRAMNHTGGCGHTVVTQMVLDRGYIHLTVTENPDGTLNLNFSATAK